MCVRACGRGEKYFLRVTVYVVERKADMEYHSTTLGGVKIIIMIFFFPKVSFTVNHVTAGPYLTGWLVVWSGHPH